MLIYTFVLFLFHLYVFSWLLFFYIFGFNFFSLFIIKNLKTEKEIKKKGEQARKEFHQIRRAFSESFEARFFCEYFFLYYLN